MPTELEQFQTITRDDEPCLTEWVVTHLRNSVSVDPGSLYVIVRDGVHAQSLFMLVSKLFSGQARN
jgi:hypothetical protein